MPESILITGGAGFVGSNLALRFRSAFPEARVIAFDNLHRRGSELNLQRLREASVDFVHGDIRCPEDLSAAGDIDLLVDCSAEPSAQAGYGGGSPEYVVHTNLSGTFHCLELARKQKADVVFLSTSRVYPYRPINDLRFEEDTTRYRLSDTQTIPGSSGEGVAEDFPLRGARSVYGATKLASEILVEEYADAYGLRCIIDRCGLLTGPWQMGKADQGVIALWLAAHHFNRPLNYIGFGGTGKQVRDFLHIDDLADLLLVQLRDPEAWGGEPWNVGGGRELSLSLAECTSLCREVTGNGIPIGTVTETRPADVRIFLTDSRRVRARAGWAPQRDATRTVGELHAWIRANEGLVKSVLFP